MKGMLLLALVMCAVGLSGCGKKGPPSPIGPPEEVTWPRIYPTH